MKTARTAEIITFAKDLKRKFGSNPIHIAEHFGIRVLFEESGIVKAHTMKMPDYPTIISIYGHNDLVTTRILCAHELGHALLHNDVVNKYSGSYRSIVDQTEYEANLFAVTLLFNESDFNIPLDQMNNYILKGILDYNLK